MCVDLTRGYHDISPVLSPRTAVFPGDTPLRLDLALGFAKGDPIGLSALTTTSHVGAHADAPSHYHAQGADMARVDLEPYFGPCQVVRVKLPRGERIRPEHLAGRPLRAERVLFRTDSFPDPEKWTEDFNSLSPELIEWLADRGVKLVGLDTPSVDPATSKDLPSHQALWRRQVRNLEGLWLEGVEEGVYTLVALPLRIEGGDGSPVRAILIDDAGGGKSK
jgi:arylformamidase